MLRRFLFTLALCLALPAALVAQAPAEGVVDHRIIPGWTGKDGRHVAALELRLAPGWKTYWRSPGDAGIPPALDWRAGGNIAAVEVHWPAPHVFWQSGMRSVGYADRLVLPISVTPRDPSRDIRLRVEMELGVCADICIPAELDFDAVLPAQAKDRPPSIIAALAARPLDANEARVANVVCTLRPTEHGLGIDAVLHMPSAGPQEEVVVEAGSPHVWVSEPVAKRRGGSLHVSAEMVMPAGMPRVIDRSRLRFTVIGSRHSVDIRGCTG